MTASPAWPATHTQVPPAQRPAARKCASIWRAVLTAVEQTKFGLKKHQPIALAADRILPRPSIIHHTYGVSVSPSTFSMAIRKKIFHNFFSNLSRRSESATRSKTLEGLFRQAKLCAQVDQELHEEEREELIERLAFGGDRFQTGPLRCGEQIATRPDASE
jgi:hypothetical protein